MGLSCAGLLPNQADGRWYKADGLEHRKQWVRSNHLLGFYYLSYTLRQCTPLTGALVVHSRPGVITESPSGCFWDRWKFSSLKLFTHSSQDRGNKTPIQHLLATGAHKTGSASFQFGEYWGMLNTAASGNPLLYRASARRGKRQWGGGAAGSDPRLHSREVARGAGDGSRQPSTAPNARTIACRAALGDCPVGPPIG